jgi:hypothetical protein
MTSLALALLACPAPDPVTLDTPAPVDTGTSSMSTSSTSTGACDVRGRSACGNRASLVQGVAQLPAGAEGPTTGNLVVAMMHRRYGDPERGGHPHWSWTFEDVDLAAPTPFVVDMCEGSATMWSEENCEYNLVVILDVDGSLGPFQTLPDEGDPAAMVTFDLSCHADGPTCLGDIALDCAGPECVADVDAGDCPCAEDSCESQSAICEL